MHSKGDHYSHRLLQDAVHWYRDTRHATWSNTNPRVSHVSSLATCNSHVAARVLTASDDGCVRVWAVDAATTQDTDSSADGSAAAPAAAARQVSRNRCLTLLNTHLLLETAKIY